MYESHNFDPIADDYAFFEAHSTEATQDLAAISRRCEHLLTPARRLRMLDVGCGTGTFTARLLTRLNPGREELELTLVEPGTENLRNAVDRLERFSWKPVQHAATVPERLEASYDIILANHALYYVPDLRQVLFRLVSALAEHGVLLMSLAGFDNALIQFWQAGFSWIGRDIPHATAETVEAELLQLESPYQKERLDYRIRFKDTRTNRMKILRFLFGPELQGIAEDYLLGLFDPFAAGPFILIETCHHLFVAGGHSQPR